MKRTFKRCSDCHRRADKGRKLCWHCTNLKKRYGVTSSTLATSSRACGVCLTIRAKLTRVGAWDPPTYLCYKCKQALEVIGNPDQHDRLRRIQENLATEFLARFS